MCHFIWVLLLKSLIFTDKTGVEQNRQSQYNNCDTLGAGTHQKLGRWVHSPQWIVQRRIVIPFVEELPQEDISRNFQN